MSTKRIAKDLESVTFPLDKWDNKQSYYYTYNDSNIHSGHVLILGVENSPYYGGFYMFENTFPQTYPFAPPVWKFLTNDGKTRFNPNLYQSKHNGKVCLSLLGTWSGQEGEKWNNKTSSFLQVLVSIQSLILVDKPYFNEPGYERIMNTLEGDTKSFEYNEEIRYYTIEWAIINNIINPPKEYQDVIIQHFKIKKDDILNNVKKWVDESIKLKIKMDIIYKKLITILENI